MKYNIPCSVIQDLLPNYIEHLTSEETDNEIASHLETCEACQKIYHLMQESDDEDMNEEDHQEIAFLKKIRKRHKQTIFFTIIVLVIIFANIIIEHFYLTGRTLENVNCNEVLIDGDQMFQVIGTCAEGQGFKSIDVDEQNGILHITFIGTLKSGIHHNYFDTSYTSMEPIKELWIGDQMIWKNGIRISPETASLYNTRHAYVGDMSENNRTASVVYMNALLGAYENELETSQEPYGWTIISKEDLSDKTEAYIYQTLRLYASALLAETENLSYVTFRYLMNGNDTEQTFTAEDISAYAGEDIKVIGADAIKLENFMKNSGLIFLIEKNEGFISNIKTERRMDFNIVNDAATIKSISAKYIIDGTVSSASVMYANGLIEIGDSYSWTLHESDFYGCNLDSGDISIEFSVTDENDVVHDIEKQIFIKDIQDANYTLHIQKDDNGRFSF